LDHRPELVAHAPVLGEAFALGAVDVQRGHRVGLAGGLGTAHGGGADAVGGGKADVVKAVYDVRLVGDDQPIAMSQRPERQRIAEADTFPHARARYAAASRLIYERVGALFGVLLARGRAGDEVLADFVATTERFGIPAGVSRDELIDVVWTLTAPEIADRLIRRCGWSPQRYEAWLASALATALIPHTRVSTASTGELSEAGAEERWPGRGVAR
jgi:hypothetical protein